MDSIHLNGAEQVANAARAMLQSAASMQRSVLAMAEVLDRHQRFLDDWLQRFSAELEKAVANIPHGPVMVNSGQSDQCGKPTPSENPCIIPF